MHFTRSSYVDTIQPAKSKLPSFPKNSVCLQGSRNLGKKGPQLTSYRPRFPYLFLLFSLNTLVKFTDLPT